MSFDYSQLLTNAVEPLAGENPAGENARYNDTYEKVKSEIMKLTAASTGAGSVDWKSIVEGSDYLLSNKTKDLTIAAYMTLALLKESRYEGLATGFKIVIGLINGFWENMFPPIKRKKARVQTFSWMDERLSLIIESIEPEPAEADFLRECKELADTLPELVREKVKDQVTGFSQLRTEINKWVSQLPEPQTEPEPEPEPAPAVESEATQPGAAAQPEAAAATSPTPAPASRQAPAMAVPQAPSELASIDEGLNAIRRIVHLTREIQPTSLVCYRLARVIKWDYLNEQPPADATGTTQIPGPRDDLADPLKLMNQASNWKDLVEDAESLFLDPAGTYFLDLQRYVATGLENQGAKEAAEAVVFETGKFLIRMPGLTNLKFASGLAFADPLTLEWTQDAIACASSGGNQNDLEKDDDLWLKKAEENAQSGNFPSALETLQKAILEAGGTKRTMNRRLEAAKLCFRFNQPQWTAPILKSLSEDLENTGVDTWDPQFCSEVWGTLIKSYEYLKGIGELNDDGMEKLRYFKDKLFTINLAMAAALSPKQNQE